MKRKFAVLTVLGALLAIAAPASSMASSVYPAGHKFEITGGSTGPKLVTSLGACSLSKITAVIPAAPTNEMEVGFPGATVTAGTCDAGVSLTLNGPWYFFAMNTGYHVNVASTSPEGIVLRFTSLPGCKLRGNANLIGTWSNGMSLPKSFKSGYHADSGFALTWANDGGTCALAGKAEAVSYEDEAYTATTRNAIINTVTDLTSPTTPILISK
jgi:hypothetical protein